MHVQRQLYVLKIVQQSIFSKMVAHDTQHIYNGTLGPKLENNGVSCPMHIMVSCT